MVLLVVVIMSGMDDYAKFYTEGTKSSKDKLLKKFEAAASDAVDKLKKPETAEAWHESVSSEETKDMYHAATGKLQASDLTTPMKDKGISNYVSSTGAKSTVDKWKKNAVEHVATAKEQHKNKTITSSPAAKVANIEANMLAQINTKRRRLGLAELSTLP